jgi:ligand-binding SRPBCC domain-containing protein
MVRGASLRHVHEFSIDGQDTMMIDTLTWRSSLGILGVIADKLAAVRGETGGRTGPLTAR